MPRATCHIPHTTYHMPHTTYHIPHTTYHIPHIPHTTYHIPHTTYHIPRCIALNIHGKTEHVQPAVLYNYNLCGLCWKIFLNIGQLPRVSTEDRDRVVSVFEF